jgi:uncharacterized membrane protein
MTNFFVRIFKVVFSCACIMLFAMMTFAFLRFRSENEYVQSIYSLVLAVCALGLLTAAIYVVGNDRQDERDKANRRIRNFDK